MQIEQIKQQQLQLLARKAILDDEREQLKSTLQQLSAIIQYADAQPQPEPEVPPAED